MYAMAVSALDSVGNTGICAMTRFFFDFRQGPDRCADAEGAEFATVENAYLEAFTAAQEMWSDLLRQRRDPRNCVFEVRNQQHDLLFVLPFQEVVDSCDDRKYAPVRQNIEQATMALHQTRRVSAQFIEALSSVQKTLAESRALLRVKV
jgi:hypothetical protein